MNWGDEKYMDDAPVWYGADEAGAWAAGYNAAVQAYSDEFLANLAKERGTGE